jgi:UDP-N-acetylmuramate dehydrogenase
VNLAYNDLKMRDWGDFLRSWLPEGSVACNLPLRTKTSLRIGGPGRWVVTVRERDQMVRLVRECTREGIPWFLLGGGTNVLFSDRGFEGLVVINEMDVLEKHPGNTIEAGAGLKLMSLVRETEARSLAGLELLAGIPGTVGGAVVGNAGAFGRSIGEQLESVELVTETGEIVRVDPEELDIDYRETRLKRCGDVVLSARFKLAQAKSEDLRQTIREILDLRADKHPAPGIATAGSFFKNLPPEEPGGRRVAAGLILDRAGALGLSVGDAAVFEKHANIVINRGAAKAADVLELAAKMKKLAYDHAGVLLEEEVRRIGFTAEDLSQHEWKGAATVP